MVGIFSLINLIYMTVGERLDHLTELNNYHAKKLLLDRIIP